MTEKPLLLTLGHSPDPDDIMLTYPILSGIVKVKRKFLFQEVCLDIELLNRLVLAGRLDISATSVPAFLKVSREYYLIKYGASVGHRYGPKLICRDIDPYRTIAVAVPGLNTTARVLAEIFLRRRNLRNYTLIEVPYDKITYLLRLGIIECGVVIHEEQLTADSFRHLNYEIHDLGEWWYSETKLPIPLGVNVVKKKLGEDIAKEISEMYLRSIEYSLNNFDKVMSIALRYSRVEDRELVTKFVKMYVRPDPISEVELKAIKTLYEVASEEKIISVENEPEIVLV